MRTLSILIALVLLLALPGCRRAQNLAPTITPTITPTPRSTPLPSLEPTIAPGDADNPIRMAIPRPRGAETERTLDTAAETLAAALSEQSGLTVEVDVVANEAEALAALCTSTGSPVVAAWLNGISSAAARAAACGTPSLQVEREIDGEDQTAATVQIIANGDLGISTVGALSERTFCRLGYDDIFTWLVPTLLMQASSISVTQLTSIEDYDDLEELIDAVASGDCDAAGMSAGDFEAFASSSARRGVDVLRPTASIPFAVLMYPPGTPLGVREALDEALLGIAADPLRADAMETLLGQSGLARVEDESFDDLDDFLRDAGVDLAQLAQ